MSDATAAPSVGTLLFDRYVVEDRLGSGSFGEVLRIRDRNTAKVYALKCPTGDISGFLEREVLFWLGLPWHRNVATAISVEFDANENPYLIMEYVPGGTLRTRLTGQPWPREPA